MSDEKDKNQYVPPLKTSEKDKVEALVLKIRKEVHKVYVEKVGYKQEINGKSGLAERVRIAIVKLDRNGDHQERKSRVTFLLI